jgi:DNA-binding LacI/PurR family transcriptional regulator
VQRGAKFSALFCHDDITTLGVMASLKENGLSIPEDVSIVGCDDISVARMLSPALTTVAQPKSLQGEIAAQMLIDMINGKSVSSQILKPHLIIRQTTKEV